ncbi:MAG: hypothetical protein EZS28_026119 [Streblomastix strix]|uniref:Uncharacterized protein n=1 Tax=Streblomastix strix TaxID=222440 RepID=A0A5J4V7U3_9EUKA|nr:MAG: hypothetical protein EZS28_026119 [Streblomastix strix]
MIKILDCLDKDVRDKSNGIILNIIKAGANELEEGQQHPYYNQLSSDGTISQLIQLYKNEDESIVQYSFEQTFAYLFRTLPLPPIIRKEIVDLLKIVSDFEQLAFLAESQENHDAILEENFESELLKSKFHTIDDLKLIYNLLKYGSNSNKIKVALAVKDKVEKFADDEYLEEFNNSMEYEFLKLNDEGKLKIKDKATGIIALNTTII